MSYKEYKSLEINTLINTTQQQQQPQQQQQQQPQQQQQQQQTYLRSIYDYEDVICHDECDICIRYNPQQQTNYPR